MTARTSRGLRLAFAVAGLLISGYLVLLHYDSSIPLYCAGGGIIDCAGVLTSPQSVWFHLPVAAYGVLWFVVAGALAAAGLRAPEGRPGLRTATMAWLVAGAATVVFLVYDELVVIGRICMWCSIVHVLVLTSLILAILVE